MKTQINSSMDQRKNVRDLFRDFIRLNFDSYFVNYIYRY